MKSPAIQARFTTADQQAIAFPYGLTLEGQPIVETLALVCAAPAMGATVRGRRVRP